MTDYAIKLFIWHIVKNVVMLDFFSNKYELHVLNAFAFFFF